MDHSNRECQSGGPGCVGVVIIVLLVLWFVGYWDKPRQDQPVQVTVPTNAEKPEVNP